MAALFLAPLYILINAYILRWMCRWMGACHYLFQTPAFRILYIGFYAFLSSTLLTGFLIKKPAALHRILKHISNYFLGTFLYILLTILLVDLGRLGLKLTLHPKLLYTRRSFVITGGICILVITFISIYGILHVKHVKTTPYQVKIHKSAGGLDSLKIVLLADTHFGYSVGARHGKTIVERINHENPDLVCIAGDIFDNDYDALRSPDKIQKLLASIKSTYGVYACWGNHDINEPILAGFTFGGSQGRYQDPRMEQLLTGAGIRLLQDEAVLVDDKFYVVGRQDPSRSQKLDSKRLTPAQLTKDLDKSKPVIFLDHQPRELSEIAQAGADLDLCGHTHDGQMFPGNLIVRSFWENSCGYLKKGNLHSIVTSGAGIWGPSMRIGTDCEICAVHVDFR
ncbi:MAG: metallophosphoesterase [Eubacteriales bacterium]|nr:metallophosphoesterase [Eubacteriales bacterium]